MKKTEGSSKEIKKEVLYHFYLIKIALGGRGLTVQHHNTALLWVHHYVTRLCIQSNKPVNITELMLKSVTIHYHEQQNTSPSQIIRRKACSDTSDSFCQSILTESSQVYWPQLNTNTVLGRALQILLSPGCSSTSSLTVQCMLCPLNSKICSL